jgi:hypothetical protein
MKIETGKPVIEGRYVAYVEGILGYLEPHILVWHRGRWTYHQSSQLYDDPVLAFMGPLPTLAKPGKEAVPEVSTEYDL